MRYHSYDGGTMGRRRLKAELRTRSEHEEKGVTQTNPVVPPPTGKGEPTWGDVMAYPLACVGAMVGAGVGVWVSNLAWRSGLYAVIVVGILTGFGAILLARRGNWGVALVAGVIGLAGGILAEWWILPMRDDDSLTYFVTHIHQVYPFDLLIIGVGAVCAAYIGWRK